MKRDGTQCSRTAQPNSYCWQHQNQFVGNINNINFVNENKDEKQEVQDNNFRLIPDLQNLVVEYLDLKDYLDLIKLFPNIYTLEEYNQIQSNLEKKLADEIKSEFDMRYDKVTLYFYSNLEEFQRTHIIPAIMMNILINQINQLYLDTLIKILNALNLTNIFTDGSIDSYYTLNGFNRYTLIGAIAKDFPEIYKNPRPVKILAPPEDMYKDFLRIELHTRAKRYIPKQNLSPLWKLFHEIYEIQNNLSYDIIMISDI